MTRARQPERGTQEAPTRPQPPPVHPLIGSLLFAVAFLVAQALMMVPIIAIAFYDLGFDGQTWSAGAVRDWLNHRVLLALAATWVVVIPLARWLGRVLAGLDAQAMGLVRRGAVVLFLGGLGLGALTLLVPALLGWLFGGYEALDPAAVAELGAPSGLEALPAVLFALPALAVAAVGEELLYRGFLLRYWEGNLGRRGALVLSAAAFTAVHASNQGFSITGAVGVFVAGIMLGVAFLGSGSLWFASGVHLGWNVATAMVVGLPVSGLTLPALGRWRVVPEGMAEGMLGGAFGPEEGVLYHGALATTLVLVLFASPFLARLSGTGTATGTATATATATGTETATGTAPGTGTATGTGTGTGTAP